MARTRGASGMHQDDGVLLDKDGKPMPTSPVRGVMHMDDGEIVPPMVKAADPAPSTPVVTGYLCDATTVRRDMEAHELFLLLDRVMGGLTCEVSPDDFGRMNADLRRHFRPVMGNTE